MIAAHAEDFGSWRDQARRLLLDGVRPEDVVWADGVQATLFDAAPTGEAKSAARVPADFLERAAVACDHADPDRFALLYRLLWKIAHGAARVLHDPLDPDATRLAALVREVREEEHRMHAFVRFRRTVIEGREHFIAWYRPAHPILARVAPFFARRYPGMPWTLFTPERSAHWDGTTLRFGPGSPSDVAPKQDELDALFLTYYATVYNPARANAPLFAKHVPRRYQEQLPEAGLVDDLVRRAPTRVAAMRSPKVSASAALATGTLDDCAAAAQTCRACPIGERATQAVFGTGPRDARLMIVGEQPGDEEDLAGLPFVGPAGRLFDQLLERVALPRDQLYVTNAVKHFKWEPRGKRRLHSRPNRAEIEACNGWLLAEVAAIQPAMILCLGATAAQSFCGPEFRIGRDRGKPSSTPWAPWWMATYHPSALLRADEAERPTLETAMLADLALTHAHWTALFDR